VGLFSGRNAELETMNRILTDAARSRTARIEELEHQLAQRAVRIEELERQVTLLGQQVIQLGQFEALFNEYAHMVNDRDKELAVVREVATKFSLRVQELERILSEIGKN
jgi:hypothetical protein